MAHRFRIIKAALILVVLLLLAIQGDVLQPLLVAHAGSQAVSQAFGSQSSKLMPMLKFQMRGIAGPYHTQGNLILGADNQPYLFHGVARDDLEYLCDGDGHYQAEDLARLGMGTSTGQTLYWDANTVRLPLSESFWLYGSPSQHCSAAKYQALVKQIVRNLTAFNLNVILDLQWTDAGGQAAGSGDAWSMPDLDSLTFWQQLAGLYKNAPNVMFEVFNEPHNQGSDWPCWRNGCAIQNDTSGPAGHDHFGYYYQGVGMQTLVDAIRQVGANNLVIVAGVNWGYDLSGLPTYHLNGTNIVYDTHPYPYGGKFPPFWDSSFGNVSAIYPVISSESGEYDCQTGYMSQLLRYFDEHDISWVGWAWAPTFGDVCSYPRLNTDYKGTPTHDLGVLIYQHLHDYLTLLANEEVPADPKR